MSNVFGDLTSAYVIYTIIKKLTLPFTEWNAYKTGLIDENGNFLVDRNYRTREQKDSLSLADLYCLNMKKILMKIPGGNSKLATYGAALYLLKEDTINEENFVNFIIEQDVNEINNLIEEINGSKYSN